MTVKSLVLAAPLAFALGCSSAPAPQAAPRLPTSLPAVDVSTLSGEHVLLSRYVEGRVALVSLWATWCDACKDEIDALNRLHEATKTNGDAVVVGLDVGEERSLVTAFAARRGLTYPLLVDEGFVFADALGQRRVPATLVLDRSGRVVFRGDALDAAALGAMRKAVAEPLSPVSARASEPSAQ
jgi:peroxiredoxin